MVVVQTTKRLIRVWERGGGGRGGGKFSSYSNDGKTLGHARGQTGWVGGQVKENTDTAKNEKLKIKKVGKKAILEKSQ